MYSPGAQQSAENMPNHGPSSSLSLANNAPMPTAIAGQAAPGRKPAAMIAKTNAAIKQLLSSRRAVQTRPAKAKVMNTPKAASSGAIAGEGAKPNKGATMQRLATNAAAQRGAPIARAKAQTE
jgi:hypothetical protein